MNSKSLYNSPRAQLQLNYLFLSREVMPTDTPQGPSSPVFYDDVGDRDTLTTTGELGVVSPDDVLTNADRINKLIENLTPGEILEISIDDVSLVINFADEDLIG